MSNIKTLEDAITFYYDWFDNFYDKLHDTEDSFSAYCQSQLSGGISMRIRNDLGFWKKDGELYHHMVSEHGLTHPDDMSDLIIRGVHKAHRNHLKLINDELN